jgi:hypothetical protein
VKTDETAAVIAKNLMSGHLCDNCKHQKSAPAYAQGGPEKEYCENRRSWGNMMKPSIPRKRTCKEWIKAR